jgi:UDP-N-acetylmuramate dehydrogenase
MPARDGSVASPSVSTCLADLTTLRLGGPAQRVVSAGTEDELAELIRAADACDEPVLVLGGGSNLVAADAGWPGVVVHIATHGVRVNRNDDSVEVTVAAGETWDDYVALTVEEGWSGLAAMSGVPGLAGATPVQNVGAYGSEVSDSITALRVLDRTSGEVSDWTPAQCGFGFRTSAFKHTDRYVVLAVTFALHRSPDSVPVRYLELAKRLGVEQGETAPASQVRDVVLELRRSKGMVLDAEDHDTWSVGSFFVNPFVDASVAPPDCPQWTVDDQVKLSAAWLIEKAGFHRGYGLPGPVSVSTKHTLALTNRGGATTAQLLELAREIRDGVEATFGVRLRAEGRLVGVSL